MSSYLDKAIVIGLLLVIVLTALAHGAVEPWSVLLMELIISALTLIWGVKIFVDGRFSLVIPPVIWPIAAFALLGLAQSIALTDSVGTWRSFSFDVEATRGAVIVLVFVIIFGLLSASFLADRLLMLARFLAIYGLVIAFLAVLQHFTDVHTLMWWRTAEADPFGSFVNRNHFAGYMELLLPWSVVMIYARRGNPGEQFFYGFAAAWMGAAAVLSLSRGGIISIFSELMLLGILSRYLTRDAADRISWQPPNQVTQSVTRPVIGRLVRLGFVSAIVAAIIAGVFWLGAEPIINRITTGNATGAVSLPSSGPGTGRLDTWRDTWNIFRANPIIGVGLGAYETAYPIYAKDNGLAGIVAQSHNDYLQVLADSGIVGGLILLWFIVTICRSVIRGLKAPDPFLVKVTIAGGVGIFGILVHSLFDFNLQLPSHALLFCLFAVVVSPISATSSELVAILKVKGQELTALAGKSGIRT